jgi:hypothetical protein
MASTRKRSGPADRNGDAPTEFQIPADALVIFRAEDGDFGFLVNGDSTVPLAAWPTVCRRIGTIIERQILER